MGETKKTPKSKTPTTKSWNINLNKLPLDESLSIDFEDEEKTRMCGVKLRSNNLENWLQHHKDGFDRDFESNKGTSVTWKSTQGATSLTVSTNTRKTGKGLLSVHFYQRKKGLMVQGQCTKWWIDNFYAEIVRLPLPDKRTRATSKVQDGVQLRVRHALDSFPILDLQTTPTPASRHNVDETPTLPKRTNPRSLEGLKTPDGSDSGEQMRLESQNDAKCKDATIKDGAQTDGQIKDNLPTNNETIMSPLSSAQKSGPSPKHEVAPKAVDKRDLERLASNIEKSLTISDTAFDDLQKQFVDLTDRQNSLRDDWITKEREREEVHLKSLKELSAQVEATQKSLEDHIKKVISKLQNDLSLAQKDLVSQKEAMVKERQETMNEMMVERNLWRERYHGLSTKVDALVASNTDLQQIIETQNAEIQALVERSKELEQMFNSCKCKSESIKSTMPPGMTKADRTHDNDVPLKNPEDNEMHALSDNEAIVKQQSVVNSVKTPAANNHTRGTTDSTEIRIFADSIFRDVDADRAFNGRSAKIHRCSTVQAAMNTMKTTQDSTTKTVIIHLGSNDLDNTKQHSDSVSETLNNTHNLLAATKTSFPNADISVSQVLQRGSNPSSSLNQNIKSYNQEMLKSSKKGTFTYIKHKKLTQDRSLYLGDQIHLNHRSGTKLLVADLKHSLKISPGQNVERSQPNLTHQPVPPPRPNGWNHQPAWRGPLNPPPSPYVRGRQPAWRNPANPAQGPSAGGNQSAPGSFQNARPQHNQRGTLKGQHQQRDAHTVAVTSGNKQIVKADPARVGHRKYPGLELKHFGKSLRKALNFLLS